MNRYLPDGFLSGYGMRSSDAVYIKQLICDGYVEVSHLVRGANWATWQRYLPWLVTVGNKLYYGPAWLEELSRNLWPLMTLASVHDELSPFLRAGKAEERARALLAAAALAGEPNSVDAVKAALVIIREYQA